jgi:hypothetical protein
MVLIYLMAEFVSGKVGQGEAATAAVVQTEVESQPAMQEAATEMTADEAASPDLPDAPVSPAPQEYSERHERRLRRGK